MASIVPGYAMTNIFNVLIRFACLGLSLFLVGCAAGPTQLPYPAFVDVDELVDVFIAGMPGIRAKSLAGDPTTRRSSNRIILPADWQFTTGASPGMSAELFVLEGEIRLGDLALQAGGYAYIPSGSTGMSMSTRDGAVLLYFVDEMNPSSVIQTPLIQSSNLLEWRPVSTEMSDIGLSVKELRADPGSGARTWLLKVDPIAMQSWRQSSVTKEGYLVSGNYRASECWQGEPVTEDYLPGGYFYRPPGAVHGGAEEKSTGVSIWFMRTLEHETVKNVAGCMLLPETSLIN
ncbi:MAG: hypothetical protein DRR15_12285 [Gammaproteobacteria bacterium]|nr:MAG: hypothetical protein DRR15_12285 [Gammaproteobacteria bacterium]